MIIGILVIVPALSVALGQDTTSYLASIAQPAAIIDVTIQDFFFSPTPVTINVGDTVRWTNNGPSQHSSTSDTGVWNSGTLGVGQTFSFTFSNSGTFAYHCSIHPTMHGSVIVMGPNSPPNTPTEPAGPGTRVVGQLGTYSTMTTDPNGDQVQYRFDWDATGSHDISAWSALVPSGQTVSMSHSWSSAGTYVVEAQAMDSLGAMSIWSTGLTVIVSVPGNTPPETPTTPTGPTTRSVGQLGTYSTSAIDPDGDQVQYRFDFDANGAHAYSAYTALMPSGQTGSMSYMWNVSGTYVVKAQAKDSGGFTSNWSSGLTVVVSSGNQPPNTPTVSGPSSGKKGIMYTFTATTTDPDGDMIEYYFDWGDGTNSGWTAMVSSGTAVSANHSWSTKGTFTVKVKARDMSLAESAFGSLSIKIPTSYSYDQPFLHFIIAKLVRLFPFFGKFIHFSL